MNWELIWDSLPKLLAGTGVTVQLTLFSLAIGLLLAVPLALARLSHNPLLKYPTAGFVFYFRGTPLLVQLFLIYYGSGQFRDVLSDMGLWTYFRNAWFCAVLTLTLNTAAYTAEIFRGAIQAVPRGEIEAGKAFGMSGWLLFRRVTLPKAFRIALPAYGNEVVFLLQATSLVSAITVIDLTGAADLIRSKTFAVYEMYLTAAVLYLIMTYVLVYAFRLLEKRLNAYQHRSA
ncbi:ABC transporter permease [Thiothrix winogradskyi]|uniref:Arginine ABC transporter permease protein ArtM n=1 Tax=Thiothrix winogradskyi TaxID=96472 RepID=A0ABY3T2B5_9GAMM|nr:ABC transporter permease [Thiothrix winogradskyi]UJS24930.1 ABC transporter permease [Thiothrix winogradskyi]